MLVDALGVGPVPLRRRNGPRAHLYVFRATYLSYTDQKARATAAKTSPSKTKAAKIPSGLRKPPNNFLANIVPGSSSTHSSGYMFIIPIAKRRISIPYPTSTDLTSRRCSAGVKRILPACQHTLLFVVVYSPVFQQVYVTDISSSQYSTLARHHADLHLQGTNHGARGAGW